MRKLSCGSVVFRLPGPDKLHGGKDAHLMGEPRVAALRAFYRRESIPGGVVPCADWYNGSADLTWNEVYWDTCGNRVTGEGK
jgi:hypothetical protein